jgi:hypothetical protein
MSTKVKKLARALLLHIADDRSLPPGPSHPGWAFAIGQAEKLLAISAKFNLGDKDAPRS